MRKIGAETPRPCRGLNLAVILPVLIAAGAAGAVKTGKAGEEKTPPADKTYQTDPAAALPPALYEKIRGELRTLNKRPEGAPTPEKIKAWRKKCKLAAEKLRLLTGKNETVLLKALRSPQALHRAFAAYVLRYGTHKETLVGPLSQTLKGDPDIWARRSAADTLTTLGDVSASKALIAGLEDEDSEVRARCAVGLGKLRDPLAVKPLLAVLKGNDLPQVRMRAASALGKIKEKSALDEMNAVLETESDPRVRIILAEAVRKTAGKDNELTKTIPKAAKHENVLHKLSKDMQEVEGKLREERHDRAVQVAEKDVENRLTQLIKQAQQMQQQGQQGQQRRRQQQRRRRQGRGQGKQQQPRMKQPSSPLQRATLAGSASRGALRAAETIVSQRDWAKLPPGAREEIQNVNRDKIPERWKGRLRAYVLSINREESQGNK